MTSDPVSTRARDTVTVLVPVRWTGQQTGHNGAGHEIPCAGRGQDAEFRAGVAWPESRFAAHGDASVDRLTGLVWRHDASVEGATNWQGALEAVACLGGAWRLPNINEFESLVDCARHRPALPEWHPFVRVGDVCWSLDHQPVRA